MSEFIRRNFQRGYVNASQWSANLRRGVKGELSRVNRLGRRLVHGLLH